MDTLRKLYIKGVLARITGVTLIIGSIWLILKVMNLWSSLSIKAEPPIVLIMVIIIVVLPLGGKLIKWSSEVLKKYRDEEYMNDYFRKRK